MKHTLMKHFVKNILGAAAALLAVGLASCDNDKPDMSQVAVFVTPSADTSVEISSGEKQLYSLDISTINDHVASLKITSFDRYNGETVWVDIPLDKKQLQYKFVYTAPQVEAENTEVTLTFTVTDNRGNEAMVTRRITVLNKIVTLAERTGIVLYSPSTGLADALSLADVTRPFNLADSPTPELADIYMVANADFSEIAWMSNTNAKFLRVNTFNYAEASASSISTVYKSSTHTDVVRNIAVNDIVIVGHGLVADGVFMVTNVIRTPGLPDCIQLNYKGIGKNTVDTPDEPAGDSEDTESDN